VIDTDHIVATRQLKIIFLLVKQVQYDGTGTVVYGIAIKIDKRLALGIMQW
jgi:hypothetical protein